ncbi:MAG: hypothetical protein AAFU73_13235 [Planctomycetota bacterium]
MIALHIALALGALPSEAPDADPAARSHDPSVARVGARIPARLPAGGREWIDEAVAAGVKFLLGSQESYAADPPVGGLPDDELADWQKKERARLDRLRGAEGAAEWPYEGVYRERVAKRQIVIPSGYRVGGTAIVCTALLAADAGEPNDATRAALGRSLDFVLDRIEDDPAMDIGPKGDYDVRGWGHAYALSMLDAMTRRGLAPEDRAERVAAAVPALVERIAANQTSMGGWNYAGHDRVSPFMTGATLLILFDAKAHGVDVPGDVVDKALDALEAARSAEVTYAYAGATGENVAQVSSSAARSAAAELALFHAGRSDARALRAAVDGFFAGWDDLLVRKSQQGTHKPPYGIAPYYFYFGHAYAARAIEALPEEERPALRAQLVERIERTREDDGTWNDRIFPRTASYSTAMAILALRAPELGPGAAYAAPATSGEQH